MAKGRAVVPDTRRVSDTSTAGKTPAGRPRPVSSGKRRSGMNRALPWVVGGLLAALVIIGLVLLVQSNTALASAPGQRIPIQGADHIEVGATHPPYNSDPPTSGPHYASALPAGFYDAPQPDEYFVHNLEHGHIWITYDCSKLANCEDVKSKLRALVGSYNQWKVVASPRQNQDAAIGVSAWGWLQKFDVYDEPAIRRFVSAWRDKGPERTME